MWFFHFVLQQNDNCYSVHIIFDDTIQCFLMKNKKMCFLISTTNVIQTEPFIRYGTFFYSSVRIIKK